MKKLYILLSFLILISVVVFADSYGNSYVFRYRIIVEVETPEGIETGSSVLEIAMKPVKVGKSTGYKDSYRGEAVMVDLGERGKLFALKRGRNGRSWLLQVLYWTFPSGLGGITDKEKLAFYANLPAGKTQSLPVKNYPLMAHLKDINDPKTVVAVYDIYNGTHGELGTVKTDRLEDIYGAGVRIRDIRIEITDDPVEFKLHKLLTWLSKPKDTYFIESPPISKAQPLKYLDFQEGRLNNE
ncbi:MAG: hypothetical protein OEY94_10805 [Alphaproteobacteria bacterium]|nr:hypothetical protein [Alphaproteobacteria bacterium]